MTDDKEAPDEKETIEEGPQAEAAAAGQPDEMPPEGGAAAQPDEGPQPEAPADSERDAGPQPEATADSEREEGPPPEPAESEPAGPPRPTMAAAGPTMAAAGPPRRSAPPRDRGDRGDRGDREERGPRRFGRRRVCAFCVDKVSSIDYKDSVKLRRYLSDRARIDPRRKTGTCAKHQRWLTTALKRARHLALLPYTSEHMRMTGSFASRR